MQSEEDERLARPDGHRYDAPESPEERGNKEIAYAALGLLVLLVMVLIATGVVPFFDA
ncbi:hypothetical protein [Nocardioides pacificus]